MAPLYLVSNTTLEPQLENTHETPQSSRDPTKGCTPSAGPGTHGPSHTGRPLPARRLGPWRCDPADLGGRGQEEALLQATLYVN